MRKFLSILIAVALALLPAGAQGVSDTGQGFISSNYSRVVEDFYGAGWNCSSGATAQMGIWTLNAGGTAAAVASRNDVAGTIRLTSGTSNLANSRAAIGAWDATPVINRPFTMGRYATAIVHISDITLDDGWVGIGFTYDNNLYGTYSGHAKGFGFIINADTNGSQWIATWGSGSAGSTSNTSIAGDDSWLRITTDGSTVRFSAASGNPYFTSETTVTTNIPSSSDQLCFGLFCVNVGSAASSTTADIDFVSVSQKRWP